MVRTDTPALKLATLFQMAFPGAPSVYYGDEIGLEGGHDPDCRRAFPWDEARWDHALLDWFRRAAHLRHAHPALRRGRYVRLHADDGSGVYAFARQGEGETLAIVLNNGDTHYALDVPVGDIFADGTTLRDLWAGGEARVANGRIAGKTLAPRSGAVLGVEDKHG
jgi:neopullulanase